VDVYRALKSAACNSASVMPFAPVKESVSLLVDDVDSDSVETVPVPTSTPPDQTPSVGLLNRALLFWYCQISTKTSSMTAPAGMDEKLYPVTSSQFVDAVLVVYEARVAVSES
jgi:hypothetical protein